MPRLTFRLLVLVMMTILGTTFAAQEKHPQPSPATTTTAEEPQAQPKPQPWTLTIEERIALRTNPVAARQRVRESTPASPSGGARANATPDLADSFDGKRHPELFMPYQIFDHMMLMVFTGADGGQGVRQEFMRDVRRHGLPPDFWLRFEAITAAFRADKQAVWDLLRKRREQPDQRERIQEELDLKQLDLCRDRADALAAARDVFGQQRFDRFLYDVIAYRMAYAADKLLADEILRRFEGGCR